MAGIFLIFGLLLSYTFIYAGLSQFWHGVTAVKGTDDSG